MSPFAFLVNFKVLVVLNGDTIAPLVTAEDGTSAPKTWYNKMSAKFGNANKPLMSVPNPVAIAVNASLLGANTV